MHGLPLLRADLDVVHLTRLHDRASRHRDGAIIHPHLDGVVTVAQAIVQTGLVTGPSDALVAADAALHRCLVNPRQLVRPSGSSAGIPTSLVPGALSRESTADLSGSSDLVAEKFLEDRLRDLGYEVVRVTWSDLAHPERILERIPAGHRPRPTGRLTQHMVLPSAHRIP